jgi:predicted nucleotidyltransferase
VRRSELIEFFSTHRDDLRRLGISSLLVFGSVARGCGVDLATPGMIRKEFRDRIYAEAVRAA